MKIYVTPVNFFTITFREIFQSTMITHRTAKESSKWLSGPDMRYWPQQSNFAFWCATTGCAISRETLGVQIKSFLMFHIYFTTRRILYQMGGIQSFSALLGDPTFNQINNEYDVASYKRICNEFGISPSSDFRFKKGNNHGLGNVYIYISNHGLRETHVNIQVDFTNFPMKVVWLKMAISLL